MEDKSNSLSRVKRHQREKVLRFSIRKYSFGAASVAVAALMFMGTNVVSADSPSQNTSSSTTGLASPKDGEQSSEAGQARNENQAEVASEPSANKEAQSAEDKATKVDSSSLSKLVEEVNARLSTNSKHDPSVVNPIKERLQKGKELLARADADQGELDSLAEDLEKDLAVLSSSSQESSQPQGSEAADKNSSSETSNPKEEGSDRAASASVPENKPRRRSRRALESVPNTVNEGALSDVRYFASVDKSTNNGNNTRNNDPDFTRDKTVIRAKYQEDNEGKWMVYDVFFNNDGKRMTDKSYQQQYYFQAPFNIMDPSNTVRDLSFTRYKKFNARRLSDGNVGFQKYGETAYISDPWRQKSYIFNNDYVSLYDPASGVTRDDQRWYVFKNNQYDTTLNTLTKKPDNTYPNLSYYLGIKVGQESAPYAVHMHAKIKLKNDVSAEYAAKYGRVYAASTTFGNTTNQSYIMGALGARLETTTEAETYPIQGSSKTKTVGDRLQDTNNPVGDGYITSKSGKDFPSGMTWSWKDNRKPSTDQAGVFTYKVIATYSDKSSSEDANSGSDGTVKFTVKPKKPTITGFENKKGLTGQQLTVNVGSGVKDGSIVKLYDGDKVIGEGRTQGQTAVVTVTDALPGRPITAETIVNNGGTVTSDRSDAVTPTEAPDTQAPILTITPASQTVTEGQEATFTVTAMDDRKAKLDLSDLIAKYGDRFIKAQAFTEAKGSTETKQIRKITLKALPEDVGKTQTITFRATDDAGHSAEPVTFTFTVTAGDKTGPTITADGATVTKNEAIQPIPVSAQDNAGGVGLRDKDPIEVSNLPKGLKYENGKITGTTNAATGFYTVKIKAYDKNNNSSEKTIKITVQEQASKYNPTGETLTVPYNHNITDDEVKAKVQNFAPGTLTVQSKPSTNTSGNVGNAVVKVTYPDGSHDTVNIPVVVGRPNKDDYTPKYEDGNGTPGTEVKIPLTEENGKKIPTGTTFESGTPGITVDKDGKVTVTIPKEAKPGDKIIGKVTVTYPDGSKEEVPVTVAVGKQDKDIYTPKYNDGNGKPGTKVEIPLTEENGKKIPTGTTFESGTPGITVDDKGKVTVTIPADKKPGDKITGKVTVTYPDGSKEEVPVKVTVTTPARKTPTIDLVQDPTTGDVTVTPKKPDGSTYPEGTMVELPGKDGRPIKVTIGADGSAKVPNDQLPDTTVVGKAKITEPGKAAVEVPNVTTPAKVTPATPTTETPGKIEIAQQPNGNAIVTPKKPDGTTYPSGTKVEIPGENGTTITVTIGDNGSGEVPNDKLPKGAVPGKGKVTEPNKKPSQPVDVTTPARKTPTIDLVQDPTTGDVTVTPKKPDGSTYPEGTMVELPGKDGRPIKVTIGADGSAKVPNDQLPDTTVVGKAKITEPGKAAVEVPNVTTPAKVTVATEQPSNSHNVLPNTGTESNATLASLGLLGMLSGLGFAFRKKKED
ncbi:YPDG domain-containing protein [Streptococcus pseudopneumoniae]|uniref:YPDG domain-containing protein n=1 Tax=Streptococcus pseudopneumoniae TaxID=257758 RepID=UPI00110C2D68|nr:YPDG domain-containing protein [Streptococcus pseudopneumoniae]TMR83163.1 YSIRK-type signal peptide-containing protein [Streptococcus pseudopneumoniae]